MQFRGGCNGERTVLPVLSKLIATLQQLQELIMQFHRQERQLEMCRCMEYMNQEEAGYTIGDLYSVAR